MGISPNPYNIQDPKNLEAQIYKSNASPSEARIHCVLSHHGESLNVYDSSRMRVFIQTLFAKYCSPGDLILVEESSLKTKPQLEKKQLFSCIKKDDLIEGCDDPRICEEGEKLKAKLNKIVGCINQIRDKRFRHDKEDLIKQLNEYCGRNENESEEDLCRRAKSKIKEEHKSFIIKTRAERQTHIINTIMDKAKKHSTIFVFLGTKHGYVTDPDSENFAEAQRLIDSLQQHRFVIYHPQEIGLEIQGKIKSVTRKLYLQDQKKPLPASV